MLAPEALIVFALEPPVIVAVSTFGSVNVDAPRVKVVPASV